MRNVVTRKWTYEDVRKALETLYGPVTGINIADGTGYILAECATTSQPSEPKEPQDEPTTNP
jgi:hypothetical protein